MRHLLCLICQDQQHQQAEGVDGQREQHCDLISINLPRALLAIAQCVRPARIGEFGRFQGSRVCVPQH